MRSVRLRLLISHLALVVILAIVMSSAISSFVFLGRGIDRVLEGNYASISAAQQMQESIALDLAAHGDALRGKKQEADQLQSRSSRQLAAAVTAARQATNEPGESELIRRIEQLRQKHLEADSLADPAEAFDRDKTDVIPQLEQAIEDLIKLNQAAMVRESDNAKSSIQEAATRSFLIASVALLFAILVTVGLSRSLLIPLRMLTDRADALGAGELGARVNIERSDEIGRLAASFNAMAANLQEAKQIEQKRLERAKKMTDQALDSLYDPVIITDGQGLIIHLNRAAEALFGPSPAAPRTPVIMHVADRLIVDAIQRVIEQNHEHGGEDENSYIPLQVGDQQRTYRLRVSPIKDVGSQFLGTVTVLEDITHLKEVDRLKTEFVGVAAHELRTPVASLLLSNELLLEGAVGELDEKQRELILLQGTDLRRLEGLMQELLDLTRLEAGMSPPKFQPVEASELLAETERQLKSTAQEQGVELVTEMGPDMKPLQADKSQIVRVLINLANNGIRHTPAGGRLTLRAMQNGDQVTFSVEDTGEGIPEAYLSRIFGRFVQVPGATGGGAGLGLAIAQNIVKAHGGKIWAESKLGEGSVFKFILPNIQPPKDSVPV